MMVEWEQIEDRAGLPAYQGFAGELGAFVYRPRRQPTRWHINVFQNDELGCSIETTEFIINHKGWDMPEEAQQRAEFLLTNQN